MVDSEDNSVDGEPARIGAISIGSTDLAPEVSDNEIPTNIDDPQTGDISKDIEEDDSNNRENNDTEQTEKTPGDNVENEEEPSNNIDTTMQDGDTTTRDANANVSSSNKRSREMVDSNIIMDPSTISLKSHKRKVGGKMIEKFWEPLGSESYKDVVNILDMCINQAIERYAHPNIPRTSKGGKGRGKRNPLEPSEKMLEAQSILYDSWISETNLESFASRMKVTPLPPTNLMHLTGQKRSKHEFDEFNFDSLLRRKTYLETYLSAELKQLHELENNYNNLELVYKSDLNYLKELRKTSEGNSKRIRREIVSKREKLDLNSNDDNSVNDDIRIQPMKISTFKPDDDPDTSLILTALQKHIGSITKNTIKISELNEKLEHLYNELDQSF
ncbi:hypothetical protein CAAN1_07S03202 [[Candida] anglica]|uniref:Uncharacterized protein n=1 Tax=[Candida] anglica TaxID=148631 RepID=A0ABP0ECH0_9ASCO